MRFCIKELDTGEMYMARNEETGADIVKHLASTFDEAVTNLTIIGSAAPKEYEFFRSCFGKEEDDGS